MGSSVASAAVPPSLELRLGGSFSGRPSSASDFLLLHHRGCSYLHIPVGHSYSVPSTSWCPPTISRSNVGNRRRGHSEKSHRQNRRAPPEVREVRMCDRDPIDPSCCVPNIVRHGSSKRMYGPLHSIHHWWLCQGPVMSSKKTSSFLLGGVGMNEIEVVNGSLNLIESVDSRRSSRGRGFALVVEHKKEL